MILKPTHKHDCDYCVLIGTYLAGTTPIDVYYHRNGDEVDDVTIIQRQGNEREDYSSFSLNRARLIARQGKSWALAVAMYEMQEIYR